MFLRSLIFLSFMIVINLENSKASSQDSLFEMGFIVIEKAYIYEEPKSRAKIVDSAGVGDYFWIHAEEADRRNWYKLDLSHGKFGWVKGGDLFVRQPLVYPLKDSVIIRESPDFNSKIVYIYERPQNPFRILGHAEVKNNNTIQTWYKTDYQDNKFGFVFEEDVTNPFLQQLYILCRVFIGYLFTIDIPLDSNLYYAKKVFQKMYDEKNQIVIYDCEGDRFSFDTKPYALDMLATVDLRENKFEEAMDKLFRIIKEFPDKKFDIGKADGVAHEKIADIYLQKGDTAKALNTYHDIIRLYPKSEISGFEWNSTVDIKAFNKIIDIYKNQLQMLADLRKFREADQKLAELENELKKVVDEAQFKVVKAEALLELAKIAEQKRQYKENENIYRQILEKYPDASYSFYLSYVHYGCEALNFLFDILKRSQPFDSIAVYLNQLINKNVDPTLSAFSKYCLARLYDEGIGSLEEVIEKYRQVPKFKFYSRRQKSDVHHYLAEARVQELLIILKRNPTELPAVIKRPGGLRIFPDGKVVENLQRAPEDQKKIFVIYSTKGEWGRVWYKIRTADNKIRWITAEEVDILDMKGED